MSEECVEQVEGAGASVPMTDISNIDVPEGTDELSRSTRRAWRDRLNDAQARKMALGTLAAFAGGTFWVFLAPAPATSLTCAISRRFG